MQFEHTFMMMIPGLRRYAASSGTNGNREAQRYRPFYRCLVHVCRCSSPNPNLNSDPTRTFILPLTPKGGLHSLDLQSYSMGDNHSIALATGLQNSRSIESLNLSDNRLSTKGLRAILKAIHPEQREEQTKTHDKVILSYFILSYLILSYPTLSYPIVSCLILSFRIVPSLDIPYLLLLFSYHILSSARQ